MLKSLKHGEMKTLSTSVIELMLSNASNKNLESVCTIRKESSKIKMNSGVGK